MYLALSYDSDTNELWGQARFSIEIEYLFLSKSVDLFVERRIAGPAGATEHIDENATALLGQGIAGIDGDGLAEPGVTDPRGYEAFTTDETPTPAFDETTEELPVVPVEERKGMGPWPWYVLLALMLGAGVLWLF